MTEPVITPAATTIAAATATMPLLTVAGVNLGLRRTDAPGLLPRAFSRLTRWRLHTAYPHAGIVAGGLLYHSTFAHGLAAERFDESAAADWLLVPLGGIEADDVVAWYEALRGAKYDWFSLLGFVLPWRVSKRSWLYCYEWAHTVMTGQLARERITPELLLSLAIKMGAKT